MPTIKDLFDLTGRVAIVTGGSRGLGEEMAEGLAEAGAALMLCARREEWLTPDGRGFAARGFRVEGRICDVSETGRRPGRRRQDAGGLRRVDILINNAGISWGARPETMPLDKWHKVIDANLTGAFLFAQAAGREMLKREYGRIINVASIAGLHAAVHGPHYAGYAATKAGLMGLTRELAATWGRQGIRVNAIAPGFFHPPPRRPGPASRPTGLKACARAPSRRRRRAEGRRRVPRLRRLELHHRPDDCRRRGAHYWGVNVTPNSPTPNSRTESFETSGKSRGGQAVRRVFNPEASSDSAWESELEVGS